MRPTTTWNRQPHITSTLATKSTPLRSPARQNPASTALAASGSPEPTTPLSSMVLHARDHLPGPSAHGPCGPPHLSPALPVADQPFSSLATPSCRGRSLRRLQIASCTGVPSWRPPSAVASLQLPWREPEPQHVCHVCAAGASAASAPSLPSRRFRLFPKVLQFGAALAQGDLHPASDCPPGPNRANPAFLPHPTQSLRPPSQQCGEVLAGTAARVRGYV